MQWGAPVAVAWWSGGSVETRRRGGDAVKRRLALNHGPRPRFVKRAAASVGLEGDREIAELANQPLTGIFAYGMHVYGVNQECFFLLGWYPCVATEL